MSANCETDSMVGVEPGLEKLSVDKILHGQLPVEVLRFGLPLALGMGLQTTFNLVDAYIIARLQPEEASASLGAIGICDPLASLGTILSYGISIASGALLSRRQGAGDAEGVQRIAWQSLLFVLVLSAAFGLVSIVGANSILYRIIGAKGRVAELGAQYLQVSGGGSFSMFLLLHLITIQRALGSSKTPITMLVVANVINLVLAVLLVYGPGEAPPVFSWGPPIAEALGLPRLELMGAAWATVLSRALALIPTTWIIVRRFGLFGPESRGPLIPDEIRRIWTIGWPTSIQLVVRILALLVTHSLVARAYTTTTDQSATTALGIVFRLETMALFVSLGWGSASQTFVGQNLGAGQPERASRAGWLAMLYNAALMALLVWTYTRWGAEIIGFFDRSPSVVETGVEYLSWVGPSYVGLGIGIVLGSAMQGAGATRLALLLDLVVILLLQVPASLVVVFGLDSTPVGLWQVLAATYTAYAVVYTLAYRRGSFLAVRVN